MLGYNVSVSSKLPPSCLFVLRQLVKHTTIFILAVVAARELSDIDLMAPPTAWSHPRGDNHTPCVPLVSANCQNQVSSYIQTNRSESDLRSCEATWAVAKKARKKNLRRQQDLILWPPWYRHVMLYHLSYEASLEAGQERVQFMPVIWRETCFQRGFIAQLVEHRISIAEAMGSNPVEASDFFFLGFLCNCEDHFHFYSLSTYIWSYIWFISYAPIMQTHAPYHMSRWVIKSNIR